MTKAVFIDGSVLLTFGVRPELLSLFANVSAGIFLLTIRYVSPLRRKGAAFRAALLVSKFQDTNTLLHACAETEEAGNN
jgi:hypothetical protein